MPSCWSSTTWILSSRWPIASLCLCMASPSLLVRPTKCASITMCAMLIWEGKNRYAASRKPAIGLRRSASAVWRRFFHRITSGGVLAGSKRHGQDHHGTHIDGHAAHYGWQGDVRRSGHQRVAPAPYFQARFRAGARRATRVPVLVRVRESGCHFAQRLQRKLDTRRCIRALSPPERAQQPVGTYVVGWRTTDAGDWSSASDQSALADP